MTSKSRKNLNPRTGVPARPSTAILTPHRERHAQTGNQATQSLLRAGLSAGDGHPLAQVARDFLEPRFGRDLGHVNVHTNTRAADSARAISAKAYTIGSNIAFAPGQYQPGTREGRRLLAHEIAHTIQQARGASPPGLVQRTIGDGHDLLSTRFSGNHALEAAFDDESEIGTGASGRHVRLLQESLLAMGYTLPGFGADGQFGPETEAAIIQFQTDANAVQIDGIVGDETMGLFDLHDTTRPDGLGPPGRPGPVPGPLPAPSATCDTPYTGVTFSLANQAASGASNASRMFIDPSGGTNVFVFEGVASATYSPQVTINAPSNARAREFQVGFAQNILSERVEYAYSNGGLVFSALPTPIKDGRTLARGYDPVYINGPRPGFVENFTSNGNTRNLVWHDPPGDHAHVNQPDNSQCAPGTPAGTLLTATFIDTFRTWTIARHRPSGCTQSLHHMDWDLDWRATIRMVNGSPQITVVSNAINVTVPDGNGQVPFIQGGPVAANLLDATRMCT